MLMVCRFEHFTDLFTPPKTEAHRPQSYPENTGRRALCKQQEASSAEREGQPQGGKTRQARQHSATEGERGDPHAERQKRDAEGAENSHRTTEQENKKATSSSAHALPMAIVRLLLFTRGVGFRCAGSTSAIEPLDELLSYANSRGGSNHSDILHQLLSFIFHLSHVAPFATCCSSAVLDLLVEPHSASHASANTCLLQCCSSFSCYRGNSARVHQCSPC